VWVKDWESGGPMIKEYHIETGCGDKDEQLDKMKALSLQGNEVLNAIFLDGDMLLVDCKLEFGLYHGEIILGDEFSPDGCRL